MIQDIAPKHFDITYHPCEPEGDSRILFFRQGSLLVLHDAAEENVIEFPKYMDVKDICGDLTYLFALEGTAFFRAVVPAGTAMPEGAAAAFESRRFFRTAKPKEYAFAAITGLHLDGWYEKNHYCGACGGSLAADSKERMLRCPVCGNMVFPRIDPAVIVAVSDGDRLLLTKYRDREYKRYALVAGFNEIGETLEETVQREVMEETGLRVRNIRYYKSQPWGFTDNILVGYFCELDGDASIHMDSEELSAAEWVPREEIDVQPEDLSLTNEMICRFIVDK